MANEYLSLDEFKVTLEMVGSSFVDYDARRALTSASRSIDEYTGRFFYQSSGTQQMLYEWRGQPCVTINDAVTVSTVEVDYDRNGTFETTWTSGTDFLVNPFNASFTSKPYEELELLPNALYRPPTMYAARVRVTGTFGWPAVPEQVKEATTILAMRQLRRAREAPFGVVGMGVDNVAVRISRADTDVAFLLDPLIKGQGVLAA